MSTVQIITILLAAILSAIIAGFIFHYFEFNDGGAGVGAIAGGISVALAGKFIGQNKNKKEK